VAVTAVLPDLTKNLAVKAESLTANDETNDEENLLLAHVGII